MDDRTSVLDGPSSQSRSRFQWPSTIFKPAGLFIDDHLMAAVQHYQGLHAADTTTVLTNSFVLEHGFLHTAIRIILAESESVMADISRLLTNPTFNGLTVTQAVDHCLKQDPAVPRRFLIRRAQLNDDEQLVREYAENPEIKEGLWRMYEAGLVNCTCEAIAMHFREFADLKDVVRDKVAKLSSGGR